ncbi:MAG TPA: alkaline phosphatase family protein [Acetobacteraceae bacterium]|nr:alkaline phosphatase family protein [Acetobacteraceae bacterium]
MRRAVLVILDGLRRDFVDAARTPHLAEFAARAEAFPAYRTAFPSATRVVTATLATGCHPARHTLQGNAMALLEGRTLVAHDAGAPDFLQHKRWVTGHSLAVPTLAERLAPHGGVIVYNNVSPGAACAHDPDGFGHVYHRAGSFGPGRIALDPLPIDLDAAGDRALTERFVADALGERQPALAVLWLGEPDHIQHNTALGSPEHLAVLREADRHAAMAIAAVERRRAAGDDVLLIVGSDHGHETVSGIVDIEDALVTAGLKSSDGSDDVLAVSSGTSSLVYLHPDAESRRVRLGEFLASQSWAGEVIDAVNLDRVGQATHNGLGFAVSLRADAGENAFGVPGRSLAAKPRWGKPDRLGCGQHGGLGRFEQSPVLLIDGAGFAAGGTRDTTAHVTDLAPTIMRHLGIPAPGMDGAPLQPAL